MKKLLTLAMLLSFVAINASQPPVAEPVDPTIPVAEKPDVAIQYGQEYGMEQKLIHEPAVAEPCIECGQPVQEQQSTTESTSSYSY